MRIPLTPLGLREIILFGGSFLLVGLALTLFVHAYAGVPFFLLALFVLSFFRDPERKVPGGPETAVSPADGKVTDIEEVDEPFLGGRALRIGIFLSVFNVHVNRVPLDGTVKEVRYQPGEFLDARKPECKDRNESNFVGFEGPMGLFGVRQITGYVARRIVCPLAEGDEVARGERMGMIKFGSRTELLVPVDAPVEVDVEVGQAVRGGSSVLLRYVQT